MNRKILYILISLVLLTTLSQAQLEFRTESPIDSYSNFDMNNNAITNLSNPQNPQDAVNQRFAYRNFIDQDGDTLLGDLYLNGNDIYGVGRMELENGTNITGNLEINGTTTLEDDINLQGNNINLQNGYLSNDGDNEGIKIDDSGNINVPSGNIVLNKTTSQYISLRNGKPEIRFTDTNSFTDSNDYGILRGQNNDLRLKWYDSNSGISNILVAHSSGDVEIPSGDLDMNNNNIHNLNSLDGGGDTIKTDDGIDLNGNKVTSSNGEVCMGQYC
ncbi:hypothetical protein [Candidatus Nanohalobium constans]|uniref:hypothetical protein n=1 Tax=Candidatus Nanohalobium constans TaxID=2565781 RepID=UPI0012984F3F|nr:hypothetical protein [Candidatus Nanohalobium constans]